MSSLLRGPFGEKLVEGGERTGVVEARPSNPRGPRWVSFHSNHSRNPTAPAERLNLGRGRGGLRHSHFLLCDGAGRVLQAWGDCGLLQQGAACGTPAPRPGTARTVSARRPRSWPCTAEDTSHYPLGHPAVQPPFLRVPSTQALQGGLSLASGRGGGLNTAIFSQVRTL